MRHLPVPKALSKRVATRATRDPDWKRFAETYDTWTNKELLPILALMRAAVNTGTATVNVALFGADPTYKTDSTAAVQRAIDAAPADVPCGLYFPPGRYKLSSSFNMAGKYVRRVYGDDRAVTTLDWTAALTDGFTGAAVTDLRFEGLTFAGESTQGTATAQATAHAGIYFTGASARIVVRGPVTDR